MATDAAPATTSSSRARTGWFLAAAVAVCLVLAGIASYYASSSPDGLEKVATEQGLDANAKDSVTADSPLADYGVAGVENERLSVGVAGVIGVGVTLLAAGGLFLLVRKREPVED